VDVPVTSPSPELQAALQATDWTLRDLWLRYFALGGRLTQRDLGRFLTGTSTAGPHEYNTLVHAVNEHIHDRGGDWPIPYRD
jgi:hypothetical protein